MKNYAVAVILGFALSLFGLAAHAALPASIGTSLTTIQDDALDLFDLVWPVVLAIFGGSILFKLFKRAGSKI